MSIIVTGLAFENPGQPDDKKFTIYDLEIVEKEKGFQNTFIIRESESNKGSAIGNNLIINTASAMVDRSKKLAGFEVLEADKGLQAHQVTIYAQRRDGDFDKCSFTEIRPTIGVKADVEFTREGGSKIRVPKEFVESEIAKIENWKRQEVKFEEASFEQEREIVTNPNVKPDSNRAKESNQEWERSRARERDREPER